MIIARLIVASLLLLATACSEVTEVDTEQQDLLVPIDSTTEHDSTVAPNELVTLPDTPATDLTFVDPDIPQSLCLPATRRCNGTTAQECDANGQAWQGVQHVGHLVNANPWVFIYQDGTWYAATWEWMKVGQTCKNKSAVAGDHIKQEPLWDFAPVSGKKYSFMVSGLARDAVTNVSERSNVVEVVWP